MKRYRSRRPLRPPRPHPRYRDGLRDVLPTSVLGREVRLHWRTLRETCTDYASRKRLGRLLERLGGRDRGAMEAALAELELATLLIRAGFTVRFLPESQARTADLECWCGKERLYLEVTAVVGGGRAGRPTHLLKPVLGDLAVDEEGLGEAQLLIRRLLGRIGQKARQVEAYDTPVVLAITVPPQHLPTVTLDLKRLAGAVTLTLGALPQIGAVLLSLWDVDPAPSRSGVRLGHVRIVERPAAQRAYPRIRMLVVNPYAASRLSVPVVEGLQALL